MKSFGTRTEEINCRDKSDREEYIGDRSVHEVHCGTLRGCTSPVENLAGPRTPATIESHRAHTMVFLNADYTSYIVSECIPRLQLQVYSRFHVMRKKELSMACTCYELRVVLYSWVYDLNLNTRHNWRHVRSWASGEGTRLPGTLAR